MKNKGFTLVELIVGMTIMGFLILGTMTVFSSSMKGFYQTKTDIDLVTKNSLGMQRVSGTLRSAVNMTISEEGKMVTYNMPALNATVDAVTGEKEYKNPIVAEATSRSFSVLEGVLKDNYSGRILAKNVYLRDPDPHSSQYGQTYAPFQLTTIGSRRALTINFITQDQVLGKPRYTRMKTTVILRNSL